MAEEEVISGHISDEENDERIQYKAPPEKSLNDIVQQDQEDESLRKYKEALLGSSSAVGAPVIIDHSDERRVLVRRLALVVEGREDIVLDLDRGDLNKLKDSPFTIKEGITYRIRIDFQVQREIVTGLKYVQRTSRKGIQVDKMTHMVGSYAPMETMQSYTTPPEDAPSGMLSRGHYTVKSLFTDDDDNEHLKWDWSFDIKKEWD
ncbi:Rho protein GDP-dissociation inhibitor [Trinorchestia longiramus]|nr:Rho protein GDP-dissociation inhibitor [Trinorchestia longiramus]